MRGTHPRPKLRRRDERGALAVMVALLATVLLLVGALAVDLGNAWARKRDVQTQVDIATVSAANWAKDAGIFPALTPLEQRQVAGKVAEYLLKDTNRVFGQQSATVSQLTTALTDGNLANGEAIFNLGGTQLRVVAPPANVRFGLANVIGQDSVDVSAEATVGLFSELPEKQDLMPFWLPDGCAYGPVDADTSNGNGANSGNGGSGGSGSGPSGSGVNTSKAGAFNVTVTPATVAQGGTATLTLSLSPSAGLNASKTPELLFEKDDDPSVKWDVNGTWSGTTGPAWTATASVGPANLTSTPGTYKLQVKVHNDYSSIISFTVTGAGPLPTTCQGQNRGNFGQLKSPRQGAGNHQRHLALNIAVGIDHFLVPFKNAPLPSCEKPTLVGSKFDDVSRDGNNCIIGSTGNDGPWIFEGLIKGLEGHKGRLHTSNGATRSGCNGGNTTINGIPLNNDLLSCYLRDGYSLADIAKDSGVTTDMLDPAVVDSPRFVWLPVVYHFDRSIKDFQPLKTFVPGFITDETAGTNVPGSSNATWENGIHCNGQGTCNSISELNVFTFNPEALPVSDRSPVTEYNAVLDRAVIRLTN